MQNNLEIDDRTLLSNLKAVLGTEINCMADFLRYLGEVDHRGFMRTKDIRAYLSTA